jgi:hypothetical protein
VVFIPKCRRRTLYEQLRKHLEPPRVSRRLMGMSHAALADSVSRS